MNLKKIVLALGSNIGNRRENLAMALSEIEEFAPPIRRSMIYQTPPVGFDQQRDFLNAAILADTQVEPFELLRLCKRIEKKLGRVENFRNGPRVIDIDIIFYEGATIADEVLEIPHPRWRERDFVLSPLSDLLEAPEMSYFAGVGDFILSRPKKFVPFSSF